MILLWRPPTIDRADFYQYKRCWYRLAKTWAEEVIVEDLTDTNQAIWWDRAATIPGRFFIWVRPEFIPLRSFHEELDAYRDGQKFVAVLHRYTAAFMPRQAKPYMWEPRGVSKALVVFQFTGQDKWVPPRSTTVDIWRWLARKNRHVYRIRQWYSGSEERGMASRSVLGEVLESPWGSAVCGRLATGGYRVLDKEKQLSIWREMVNGWERYLN